MLSDWWLRRARHLAGAAPQRAQVRPTRPPAAQPGRRCLRHRRPAAAAGPGPAAPGPADRHRPGPAGLSPRSRCSCCWSLAAAQPAMSGDLRAEGGMSDISAPWRDAVDYLGSQSGPVSVLVLPGSGFAVQTWGRTVDEPIQVLGSPPWVARAQSTVAPAGTLRLLDSIETQLGRGSAAARLRRRDEPDRDHPRRGSQRPRPGRDGCAADRAWSTPRWPARRVCGRSPASVRRRRATRRSRCSRSTAPR